MSSRRIPRVGIGGPVGSGKTMLIEQVVPLLSSKGYKVGIISNDVVSREDADRMRRNLATEKGLMAEDGFHCVQDVWFISQVYFLISLAVTLNQTACLIAKKQHMNIVYPIDSSSINFPMSSIPL